MLIISQHSLEESIKEISKQNLRKRNVLILHAKSIPTNLITIL